MYVYMRGSQVSLSPAYVAIYLHNVVDSEDVIIEAVHKCMYLAIYMQPCV